jgi:predicted enzyme related to lactoylglutathione lyase
LLNYLVAAADADTKPWAIPLTFYNERVNLPFGILTNLTGSWVTTAKDGSTNTQKFAYSKNVTVNVNMPFSIFFNMNDLPEE